MDTSLEAAAKAAHAGTHAHGPAHELRVVGQVTSPEGHLLCLRAAEKTWPPSPLQAREGASKLPGFTGPSSGSSSLIEADLGKSGSRGEVGRPY